MRQEKVEIKGTISLGNDFDCRKTNVHELCPQQKQMKIKVFTLFLSMPSKAHNQSNKHHNTYRYNI